MAGDGNHPLNPSGEHLDDLTLTDYVLEELSPAQAQCVRQHVERCPQCRARVVELRAFCSQIRSDLQRDLEAAPQVPLRFDPIARGWRTPRHPLRSLPGLQRVSLLVMMIGALAWLAVWGWWPRGRATLRALGVPDDYSGPPVVVAAVSSDGLVVVRLAAGGVRLEQRISYVTRPVNLQFSPDGAWLAFGQSGALHLLAARTDDLHVRLPLAGLADWAWSPDGQALAYTDGAGQLWLFDCQTQTTRLLVPADESAWGRPVWRPDGTQIAYVVADPLPPIDGKAAHYSLWRVDVRTGLRVELTRHTPTAEAFFAPAAWLSPGEVLVAWGIPDSADDGTARLYRVDVNGHVLSPLTGQVAAQGLQLLWPIGPQGKALVWHEGALAVAYLAESKQQGLAGQATWPQTVDWSPNGAWVAYTVAGAPEGLGVYVYALDDARLRPVLLPGGATEKMVVWAGPEHLFVLRQPNRHTRGELWLVSLGEGAVPQRVMDGIQLPGPGPYNGWRWSDVVAVRMLESLP